ncbi:DinB family protein [Dactylosporangium sp. NPDC000244]|uniref:DinB family protein n=1 Tax=Dactylosporangium sp. NPDC000244 TaxID=3154365 RepID=UPI00331873B1|nr:DinB family protein [Dactylosporangium thailandense]
MDLCEECGFAYDGVAAAEVAGRLGEFAGRYADALDGVADVRRRPAPGVWSALEYTCHVRDVLRVQRERLDLALHADAPEFAPMGRDELAVTAAYNRQDPAAVLAALGAAADVLGTAFAALGPAELDRIGLYPWPEPVPRTLLWLGRHTVHEGEHHLMDIKRQ